MKQFSISPIGHIDTPFKQKFAIPRQPNIARAKGEIILDQAFNDDNVFKGLEGFSHVWLLFVFHQTVDAGFKSTVKAPRLGGNKPLGVFASRSTHRPNAIGMSVVEQLGWRRHAGQLKLLVRGVDLLDKTPIVDIKPYLPYADKINNATTPFDGQNDDAHPEKRFDVYFSPDCRPLLNKIAKQHPDFEELTSAVLQQDPRPAYKRKQRQDDKNYAVQLYDYDLHWRVEETQIRVYDIKPVASCSPSV